MSEDWVEENLAKGKCVLTWSSKSSILNFQSKSLMFHTVDRQVLNIVRALVEFKKSAVIVYPVRRAEIAIPACVEACYALMESDSARKKVLLISSKLDVQEIYSEMRANHMVLNEVFPLGIIGMKGQVKTAMRVPGMKISETNCVFLHSTNPRLLPNETESTNIGCVIIETAGLEPKAIKEILHWAKDTGVPIKMVLETDPYSESLVHCEREMIPVWGWDTNSLETDFQKDLLLLEENEATFDNSLSLSVKQITNWIKGIEREIIEIKDEDVLVLLEGLLQTYYEIKNAAPKMRIYRQAASLIFRAKCAFESACAPVKIIEKHCSLSFLAKSLSDRIEQMKRFAQVVEKTDGALASHLMKAKVLSESLLQRLDEKGTPKYETVKRAVREAIATKSSLAIVSYNPPYSEALQEALEADIEGFEEAKNNRILTFLTLRDQFTDRIYDRCMVYGRMPFRSSWLLRVAWAPHLDIMLYPTEKVLLKKQFEMEEQRYIAQFSRSKQKDFIRAISGENELKAHPPSPVESAGNRMPLTLNEKEAGDAAKLQPLLSDLFDEEQETLDNEWSIDEVDADLKGVSRSGDLIVQAAKIQLSDGTEIFVSQHEELPVFRKGKLDYYLPQRVKNDDHLVLIRGRARGNIASEILRKADMHPTMREIRFLVLTWVAALRKGMAEAGDTPEGFLKKLQVAQEKEGYKKIKLDLTVKSWMKGHRIGPINKKNIKLIGEIYKQQFLIDHYKEIGDAISRLRGLHHQILRRLDDLIINAGVHRSKRDDSDAMIDEEFNLHVSDFTDVISLHRVSSVEMGQEVERSKINRIRREDDE